MSGLEVLSWHLSTHSNRCGLQRPSMMNLVLPSSTESVFNFGAYITLVICEDGFVSDIEVTGQTGKVTSDPNGAADIPMSDKAPVILSADVTVI
jgi:hypothetical protein